MNSTVMYCSWTNKALILDHVDFGGFCDSLLVEFNLGRSHCWSSQGHMACVHGAVLQWGNAEFLSSEIYLRNLRLESDFSPPLLLLLYLLFYLFEKSQTWNFKSSKKIMCSWQLRKNRIFYFHPDNPVMRSDTLPCLEDSNKLSVASIRMSGQHVQTLFKVWEDSNFSLQSRIEKTACIRPNNRATPFGRGPW